MQDESGSVVEADLPHEDTAPGIARRVVRTALADEALTDVCDDVVLLVSEVVTNAVLHGRPPLRLRLKTDGSEVTVTVSDAGPMFDLDGLDAFPQTDSVSRRGLAIVAAVAEAWGQEPSDDQGKAVWFRVRSERNGASHG